ncbi:hypothetical protein CR513_54480, partial [Mucuna pruriens]
MVTYEIIGYALVWWNQFCREIRGGRRRHVDTWADLKREMRTSVKEYHKDMKVALSRANLLESNKATMARFLYEQN